MCQILNFQLSQRHNRHLVCDTQQGLGGFQSQRTVAHSMTCKDSHQVGSRTRWSLRRSAQLSLEMSLQETKTLKQNPNNVAFQGLLGNRRNRILQNHGGIQQGRSALTGPQTCNPRWWFQEKKGLQQKVPKTDWTFMVTT